MRLFAAFNTLEAFVSGLERSVVIKNGGWQKTYGRFFKTYLSFLKSDRSFSKT